MADKKPHEPPGPLVEVKFNCEGHCGRYSMVPWSIVQAAVKKGIDITQVGYVCQVCRNWFNKNTSHLLLAAFTHQEEQNCTEGSPSKCLFCGKKNCEHRIPKRGEDEKE